MNTSLKKIALASLKHTSLVGLATITLAAATANAGSDVDVAVASTYLFRGVDQSNGNAQVSGTLGYTFEAGVYTSIWGSSAGEGTQEYDLTLGYAFEVGPVSFDLGIVNYVYPGDDAADTLGAESEAYIGLAIAGFEFYYMDNISGEDSGYQYLSASYSYDRYAILLGQANPTEAAGLGYDEDYLHLDLSYAVNNNLTFTLSKVIDVAEEAMMDDDAQFVVSLSLPLEM